MFGKFIKKQRIKRNLTQEYTAKKLNISRPTYASIEKGRRDLKLSEVEKLADIFDMPATAILKKEEVKPKVILEEKEKETEEKVEIRVEKKDLEKFKQILLYILNEVGGKPNVGETVLHKLLYFIDFDYYEKYEENLMGGTYIKNHHGPTSVELESVIGNMQKKREIEAVESDYFNYRQKKYLPRKLPDLNKLSAREVSHIDDVLARLSDKNASEIERYSHQDIPWKTAQEGKPLSYESVFYRDERYSVRNYKDEL